MYCTAIVQFLMIFSAKLTVNIVQIPYVYYNKIFKVAYTYNSVADLQGAIDGTYSHNPI